MQLILMYFDPIKGSRPFYMNPRDVDLSLIDRLKELMDLEVKDKFFEYREECITNSRIWNYLFDIPSLDGRGRIETLMLSIVTNASLETIVGQFYMKTFLSELLKIEELYKIFYPNKYDPSEIDKKIAFLTSNLAKLYEILSKREKSSSNVELIFRKLNEDPSQQYINRTILSSFITSIDAQIPEGAIILYQAGHNIGEKIEKLFKHNDINKLLGQLKHFWKQQAFGEIDEIKFEKNRIYLNVYDCFECSHLPNLGQTMCRFDEGFLSSLLSKKLKEQVNVKELECYATGKSHCRFLINFPEKKK